MINLEQLITFPNLLVDVAHMEPPRGFGKLVILDSRAEKTGKKCAQNIHFQSIFFQVVDQNMEVIGLFMESIFLNIGLLAAFPPCLTRYMEFAKIN